MAEQRKPSIITRAAKRKATAFVAEEPEVVTKKRVVLGELPNLSNVIVQGNVIDGVRPEKMKCGTKRNVKNAAAKVKTVAAVVQDVGEKLEIEEKSDDPQMCEPYVDDIFEYLHNLERGPSRRPLPNYLEKVQTDVSASMRAILVDWLLEVADEYKLLSETLFLTISYVDRFLSVNVLNRQKLQLLGVSSMLIASKYEEISPPHVEDFCHITDDSYTKEEVLKMEADILKCLKFEMGNPTVKTFLRRFARIAQVNCETSNLQFEFLSYYLAELSLLDYSCVKFLPSLVAASIIFLARFIIFPNMHPWNVELQNYSRYKPADIKECSIIIHDLYLKRRGAGLNAAREKYKQHKDLCFEDEDSIVKIDKHAIDIIEDVELLEDEDGDQN